MELLDRERENLNIALRTKSLYKDFMDQVLQIAPQWLTDSYKANIQKEIQGSGGGDIRPQIPNAEISLFRRAYQQKVSTTQIGNGKRNKSQEIPQQTTFTY